MAEANQLKDEYFPHLDTMEVGALHQRREEILVKAGGVGNMANAPDNLLAELIAVNRQLRKKAAVSGGGRKKSVSPRPASSIDSLA